MLSAERRTALLGWLRDHDAIAIEDDYDAEYRYDRAAVGALQGLEPDRVVYAGSASKTLAPALRLGWLVVPPRLLARIREEKLLADLGTARIEQHAFADFLARGELDRHLRRMRARYRARRDALVDALAEELPEATVRGIAAGLHVTVELPAGYDEQAIARRPRAAASRSTRCATTAATPPRGPAVLMLGYGQPPEPAIRAGVRELAAAVRAARGGAGAGGRGWARRAACAGGRGRAGAGATTCGGPDQRHGGQEDADHRRRRSGSRGESDAEFLDGRAASTMKLAKTATMIAAAEAIT